MRKAVGKAIVEVEGIIDGRGLKQLENSFKSWVRNANMSGLDVFVVIEPEFEEIPNES